ncbi:carbohydrate-binding module family 50 protein [Rhypophila decipiens]
MSPRTRTGLIFGLGLAAAKLAAAGSEPGMPTMPDSSSQCVYWYDNNGFMSCEAAASSNWITVEELREYNPSIGAGCTNFQKGFSYCVEIDPSLPIGGGPTTTSTSTSSTSTTTSSTKTSSTTLTTITTKPTTTTTSTKTTTTSTSTTTQGNGITTPTPLQREIVSNCDAFYMVKDKETCDTVAKANGISVAQLQQWNPSAGSNCAGLWANAYACVSTIGHTPTPVAPGNGIQTPSPLQQQIVSNCDAFYKVQRDENCDKVASKNGISVSQLQQWNPSVGSNCAGLWADAYACVSIIGHTPTPVNPGNGVQTPTPIQDGMTKSCKTFHLVSGQTCQSVLDRYKITLASFYKWNPAVGNSCQSMWDKTYVCVAVL